MTALGRLSARLIALGAPLLIAAGCASKDKPTREMIYASAAIRAAERAQAEKRSPDLYRKAENAFSRAQRLYYAKEYQEAGKAALDAKRLSEAAELDAEVKEALSSSNNGGDGG